MSLLFTILYFILLLVVMFVVMFFGRKYIFSKVRINKYIPLAISIVLFLVQLFALPLIGYVNWAITAIMTVTIVFFFLWFLDIQSTGGPKKKEKKIEIRPKAKPNRVKHLKNNEKK